LEVSRKLCHFFKDHHGYFRPDGSFVGDEKFFGEEKGKYGGHFHAHTNCLLAFVECGTAAKDQELLDFAKMSYEYARGPRAYASTLTGFFPEFLGPEYPNSEGCPVADMVALAVMLSRDGVGDYWDDADRWLRNYFSEIQLSPEQGVCLDQLSRKQPQLDEIPYHASSDRTTERNIGAFAGWPAPNDWIHHIGIQHCCTGNGARAIYYAWESILKFNEGNLKINLLLNRASPWADIYSSIPYEGKVEVKIKQDCKSVAVRMPEWIKPGDEAVKCEVGGKSIPFKWDGRYINLGSADAGKKIVVTFPIEEKTVKEKIAGTEYTLVLRGNAVVQMDPKGPNCPLYQREHMRTSQTPWHKTNRFVSHELIAW